MSGTKQARQSGRPARQAAPPPPMPTPPMRTSTPPPTAPTAEYVPHIDMLLQALRINRDRLNSKSKIAIDAKLLRMLIQSLVAKAPFSAGFYTGTYPDIAEAHASGSITDLHRHFIEAGFFEGRFGAPPPVDDAFYTDHYDDVREAVENGDVTSASDHYMRSGAAEGRVPQPALKPLVDSWNLLLREDAARAAL